MWCRLWPGVTARLWVHRKLVIIIIPQQTIYYEFIALPQSPLSSIRQPGTAAISYHSDSGNKLLAAGGPPGRRWFLPALKVEIWIQQQPLGQFLVALCLQIHAEQCGGAEAEAGASVSSVLWAA